MLTFYHLSTIAIEKGLATKIIHSDVGTMFVKNWLDPRQLQQVKRPIPSPQTPPLRP